MKSLSSVANNLLFPLPQAFLCTGSLEQQIRGLMSQEESKVTVKKCMLGFISH